MQEPSINGPRTRRLVYMAGLSGIVLTLSRIAPGAVVISDGTFNGADWTTQIVPGGAGTATVTQAATGGSPGSYQQLQFDLPAAYPVPPEDQPPVVIATDLEVFCIYNAASYDPGVSGAISSLTFSMYTKDTDLDPHEKAQIVWAVYQSGVFFADGGLIQPQGDTFWKYHGHGIVSNTAFEALDHSHPDFSAAGAPITFGYLCAAINDDTAAAHTHTLGVENWSVNITPVPEPGSLSLLGLAAATMMLRRHRRSAPPARRHPVGREVQ